MDADTRVPHVVDLRTSQEWQRRRSAICERQRRRRESRLVADQGERLADVLRSRVEDAERW